MRCNCESGYCAHHHGDPDNIMDALPCPNEATGEWRMMWVGDVCAACATRTIETDGEHLIQHIDNQKGTRHA